MSNPMSVTVGGVKWLPFSVEFDTQEGEFSFTLYALDWAHALMRLEELKATARIVGEIQGEVKA